jgi:hypothetical protein
MRKFASRVGWILMGYPYEIGWEPYFIFKVPLWAKFYRFGARIHDWGSK